MDTVSPHVTLPRGPPIVVSTMVTSLHRFKGKGHRPTSPWEEYQSHVVRRACEMGGGGEMSQPVWENRTCHAPQALTSRYSQPSSVCASVMVA